MKKNRKLQLKRRELKRMQRSKRCKTIACTRKKYTREIFHFHFYDDDIHNPYISFTVLL